METTSGGRGTVRYASLASLLPIKTTLHLVKRRRSSTAGAFRRIAALARRLRRDPRRRSEARLEGKSAQHGSPPAAPPNPAWTAGVDGDVEQLQQYSEHTAIEDQVDDALLVNAINLHADSTRRSAPMRPSCGACPPELGVTRMPPAVLARESHPRARPAFWQQTLQHEDTQQRLAANVFRGVSVLDHAPST